MPSPRPNLQHYLDAHPHDLTRAVEAYRAALHAWDFERTIDGSRGPAVPWRPLAVGLGLLVVALLLMRALADCSAATKTGARQCVEACGRETDACLRGCAATEGSE